MQTRLKKPKIALITQDFHPITGGIATHLKNVYHKYFRETYFNVIVPEYIGKKEDYASLPFKVYRTEFSPFTLDAQRERCNKKILNILEELQPDTLLFGHMRSHPEVGFLYKEMRPSSKVCIFIHAKEAFIDNCICKVNNISGTHKGYLSEEVRFYKSALNKADFIFAVSNFTKSLLAKQGISKNVCVVPPSVPIKRVTQSMPSDKREKITLLSVGRLIKRKGQDKILEIMPQLHKKYPNLIYIIAGDGPEKQSLKSRIKRLSLENCVTLAGNVPDDELSYYYSHCDIFVLPCDFLPPNNIEGFGIVFLEANSYGKPVVGGNSGGVRDAIEHGKSGLLVNPRSSKDLKQAISYLIENNNKREEMGAYGKDRVIKNFSGEKSDYLLNLLSQ